MPIKCPPLARTLFIADDAMLAAQASSALAPPGHYLPVIEGPRFLHPDSDAELVRRSNAADRVRPNAILMAGMSDAAFRKLGARFAAPLKPLIRRVSMLRDIKSSVDAA